MMKKILLGLLATYFIVGSGNGDSKIKNQKQEETGKTSIYEINASKKPFDLAESIREEKRRHYTKEYCLKRLKEIEEQKWKSDYNKTGYYENALKVFKFKLTNSEKVNLLEKLLNHYENSLLEGDTIVARDVPYDNGYIRGKVSVAPEIRKRIEEIKNELEEIKSYKKGSYKDKNK